MKKTRFAYHYYIACFQEKKRSKNTVSLFKSMLQTKNKSYWKTARVVRKNIFNCTNVVEGVKGDSQIANIFKDKI